MCKWMWFVPMLCVFLSTAAALYYYTKRTMDRIENMLDEAKKDGFTESVFSESRLSALETKFADYFSASAISARNVAAEKDRVEALVADISHQTKTPVANLLLYSELLMEENLPEEPRFYAEAIYRQTERLRFLIDSLVKLSRLENGILKLSPRREPLRPLLQLVYEQFLPKAEQKGLNFCLRDTEVFARFDPKWTAEALANVLDNAIKYTHSGGVTISVQAYPLFARIDIADTGIGISEDEQANIFSRFYRSEAVRDSDGVGIGLYLAREIIFSEDGYIKVSSKVGCGATFSIFLPECTE